MNFRALTLAAATAASLLLAPAAQADNKAIAAPRMDHRVNGSAQMAATAPRGGVSNSALCGDGKSAPCGLA